MEYDIKRGHHKNIEGDGLKGIMEEIFGESREEGDLLVAGYGAIPRMEVKILSKSSLWVETESDPSVPDEVARETINRFNRFLERATGFTAKQRRDRLNKKAKKGGL
ncbi:MAG: DUF5611 family protein [Methanomassiliicoccales archaeon]